jgi:hypothetical protein
MHNLGRGMWRRVGDFERIQVPQILRQSQFEQALLYQEYIKKLQRHNRIQEYRRQILEKVNNPINVETELKFEKPINNKNINKTSFEVEDPIIHEIIAVETELSLNEQSNSEEKNLSIPDKKDPVILAKKGRKRR